MARKLRKDGEGSGGAAGLADDCAARGQALGRVFAGQDRQGERRRVLVVVVDEVGRGQGEGGEAPQLGEELGSLDPDAHT